MKSIKLRGSILLICLAFISLFVVGCGGPKYAGVSMSQEKVNEIDKLSDKTNTLTKKLKSYVADNESMDNTTGLENALSGFKKASNDTFAMEVNEDNVPNLFEYDSDGYAESMNPDGKISLQNSILEAIESIAQDATNDKDSQKKIVDQFVKDTSYEKKLDNIE